MGLAERHVQYAREPVGEIGGGRVARARRRLHALGVGRHILDHAGNGGERERERPECVEDAFLVLLHVLRIGERQTLHHGEQPDKRAHDPSGLAAHELGRVGVAFLRHDRGAGREGVRQPDEAELRRRPQHKLLGEAGEMARRDRPRAQCLKRKVAVGDAVERIGGRPVEAEGLGGHVAVDREGGAGQRRAAQRTFVEAPARVGEAPRVAPEHLDIGHEMMA